MEQTQSISSNPVNSPFRFWLLFHLLWVALSIHPSLCWTLLPGSPLLRNCRLPWSFSVSFIRYLLSSKARRSRSRTSSTPCGSRLQGADLFLCQFLLEISNQDHVVSASNTWQRSWSANNLDPPSAMLQTASAAERQWGLHSIYQ
jgi:hypothetical protein